MPRGGSISEPMSATSIRLKRPESPLLPEELRRIFSVTGVNANELARERWTKMKHPWFLQRAAECAGTPITSSIERSTPKSTGIYATIQSIRQKSSSDSSNSTGMGYRARYRSQCIDTRAYRPWLGRHRGSAVSGAAVPGQRVSIAACHTRMVPAGADPPATWVSYGRRDQSGALCVESAPR